MRLPSATAWQAVQRLVTATRRTFGRDAAVDEALAGIRAHDDPVLASWLLDVAATLKPGRTMELVAQEVRRLVARIPPRDLPAVERSTRVNIWYGGPTGWPVLRPLDVPRLATAGAAAPWLLGVASFHANGYVREAAVTALDAIATGEELPFLVLRRYDWVASVRTAAARALERRLDAGHAEQLVGCMPLAIRLRGRSRADDLVPRIAAVLADPAAASALGRALGDADRTVRRLAHRVLRDTGRGDWLARASHDADPIVRAEALDVAIERRDCAGLSALLPRIATDVSPRIRRRCLDAAVLCDAPEATTLLYAAMMDRNAATRETARFHLRRRGDRFASGEVYEDALREGIPSRVAIALAAIGYEGDITRVADVRPWLGHASSRVRRAAVRALGLLGADVDAIAPMLLDRSPAVAAAARVALEGEEAALGAARLRSLWAGASSPHSRRDITLVVSRSPKWDSITLLLEILAEGDEDIRALARRMVLRWLGRYNRVSPQPTSAQIVGLARALERTGDAIDVVVRRELRAIAAFWRAHLPA